MSKANKHVSRALIAVGAGCGLVAIAAVAAMPGATAPRQQAATEPARAGGVVDQEYSPVTQDQAATNLYWGDTHLHTDKSIDSYAMGNQTLSAEHAYRFARGEALVVHNGMTAKLRRPLDFLVVADHAESLGGFALAAKGNPEILNTAIGQEWATIIKSGKLDELFKSASRGIGDGGKAEQLLPESIRRRIWSDVAQTADRFNAPGQFTALIGYEWSATPQGKNLHRVVMFKDGADKAAQTLPFGAIDSDDPEALWRALEGYEKTTGGEVLAIPHNGNVSNGEMFLPKNRSGEQFTRQYAETRSRWEPVVEVTQTKGDGETHRVLSPTDEFADFERWDEGDILMTVRKQQWMLRYEYARSALQEGLKHDAKLGANPFKFGMIGSTDSHNALSTVAEHDFWGKFPHDEPSAERSRRSTDVVARHAWQLGASGLAAVWAPENTREAIFAAFKRREVYGTTGSRIHLRFFGGFDFAADDVQRPNYARIGYAKGVPMGGDLLKAPAGKAPRFMVVAAKDPDEANLDRIQIVKGWLDARGETHEKIYDVALSDGRKVDPKTGKAPPVGSTVDVANASYTNSIGDPELATVWTDPDFDPKLRAFYYVRVLEIPKPRWTAYDAKFYKVKMPANVPMTVQDRAYSSPIWYQP